MAQISGITHTAQSKIITALNEYSNSITGTGYGFGGITKYVRGSAAEKEVSNLINALIREMKAEVAKEIDTIENLTLNLDKTYSRIDSSTTFTKS